MPSDSSPRGFLLLTSPRTGSNLLVKMLALDGQPNLLSGEKKDYFFLPSMILRMRQFRADGTSLNDWTEEERKEVMTSYQDCFDNLQKHVTNAEAQGKDVFVKEHAQWLMEPVAETKWVFGNESTCEEPWMVQGLLGKTRSTLNETIFPDEFLRTWLPTFLIHHPALAFPSFYRTCVDIEGPDVARAESRQHALETTLRWSRVLYDWYACHLHAPESGAGLRVTWPVILDADDVIMEPQVLLEYSKMVGFDPAKVKFSWPAASELELDKIPDMEKRMLSTLLASTGLQPGKTSNDLNIAEEAKKWRAEFGEAEGRQVETWVRDAMPDYEYMRARRLRPHGS